MPKNSHRRFGNQGRRRIIYREWPDGMVSVTVVGLLPPSWRLGGRRDWAFNAGSMVEARQAVADWQRHTGLS
jgi:hypothetical protein